MKTKSNKENITIEKLDHYGRGLFFLNDKINFVSNALPGEDVDVSLEKETKKYGIYNLVSIRKESKSRMNPFCPYFNLCGGCNLQHLSYDDTIDFKVNKLEEIFNKFKIKYPKIDVIKNSNPYNYRNKIELKILNNKIGFYKLISHDLVDIKECKIASKPINLLLDELKKIDIKAADITIRSNYNNELLLWIKSVDNININRDSFSKNLKIASIIINNQVLYGEDHLIMKVNDYLFKCSYDAFFQVNPNIYSNIADIIEDNIKENQVIADLYCGVGFLGILAASKAKKIYGIEIVENAIKDALVNVKINKIDNIYFMLGDVSKIFDKIEDKINYLIVDPPRSGLDENTIDIINNNKIINIFYMSCDPITLARDLNKLDNEYKIKKVYLLDMFSWTYHIETICILERKE